MIRTFKRIIPILFVFSFLFCDNAFAQDKKTIALNHLVSSVDSIRIYAWEVGRNGTFYARLDRIDQEFDIYSQEFEADSLFITTSTTFYQELIPKNPQKAFEKLNANAELASELGYIKLKSLTLHSIGSAYYSYGLIDQSVKYFLESSEVFLAREDWVPYAFAMIDIGNVYYQNDAYDIAVNYYDKSKEYMDKFIDDSDKYNGYAVYYNNLGLVNFQLNELDKAERNFRKALDNRKKAATDQYSGLSYNYIVKVKHEKEESDSVIYYLKLSVYNDSLHNMVESLTFSLGHYASYLSRIQKKYKKAIELIDRALILSDKSNLEYGKTKLYYTLAGIYYAKDDMDLSEKSLLIADSLAKSFNIVNFEELINTSFINLYKKLPNYKKLSEQLEAKLEMETLKKEHKGALTSQAVYEAKMRISENEQYTIEKKNYTKFIALLLVFAGISMLLLILLFITARTRKKQARVLQNTLQKLESSTRHKDMIYSIIAHDLRGPLGSVNELLKLIRSQDIKGDRLDQLLSAAQNSTSESFTLLKNLLDWANLQQNRISFQPLQFDINEVLRECKSLFNLQMDHKNIELRIDLPSPYYIYADKKMLLTVLCNLIGNAIKFSNANSVIEISAKKSDKFSEIYIKDNGVGISSEKVHELFKNDVFDTSPGTENESGSGLGLKICQQFLKIHEGNIEVKSTEGEGSVFCFSLPYKKIGISL